MGRDTNHQDWFSTWRPLVPWSSASLPYRNSYAGHLSPEPRSRLAFLSPMHLDAFLTSARQLLVARRSAC